MTRDELQRRAERHAAEAERLLANRWGFINNDIKAGAHASLAVYYANEASKSAD
jgi:hypothetical protein